MNKTPILTELSDYQQCVPGITAKLSKWFYMFIGIFSFLISSLIFVFSLKGTLGLFPFFTIILVIIGVIVVLFANKTRQACSNLILKKTIFAVAIVMMLVAVLLRFYPILANLKYFCKNDLSDCGVHYFAAQQLAQGYLEEGILNYEKLFPFLFPYSLTLSLFNRICFLNIDLAIVISNFIFDAVGGLFLYLFLKRIKKGTERIGLFLWTINPFSIFMCWLPLNLILTSSFLMCILYVSYVFLELIKKPGLLKYVFSCILGFLLFFANLFRPIYTVVFIALCLIIAFDLLKEVTKERIISRVLCIVMLSVFLFIPTTILNRAVKNHFNDDLMVSSGSWNFFVGANYDTSGKWSSEDSRYFFVTVNPKHKSVTSAFAEIKEEGIERYKQMDLKTLVFHFSNKFNVLFGDTPNSIHNLTQVFKVTNNSKVYLFVCFAVGAFFTFIAFLSTVFLFINRKSKETDYQFFKLCYSGFSLAFLLVEVMNRYSSILYPVLIILAVFAIDFCHKKLVAEQ